MQSPKSSAPSTNTQPCRSPTPPLDSSIEDIDDICIDQDLENLDDIPCAPAKHFLDYDSIPPPGFEEDDDCSSTVAVKGLPRYDEYPNETRKVDKKYETDGEISDFELAGSNVMKSQRKEQLYTEPLFVKNTGARRKKHFLDENPIAPDYEMDHEREHRSLDRNFERAREYDIKYERKHSLDRERPKRVKESFQMARFLERDSSPVYHGTWPADRPNDTQYSGNYGSMPSGELKHLGPMGPKVECVYSLLSMLGCNDQLEMSSKFLELSKTPETCAALRHSRCIPLIVQMIHSDADEQTRKRASLALHNVVNCHPDDKAGRREAKVLRHIEQIMEYCETLKSMLYKGESMADYADRHPSLAICSLMKISFDEEHRHAMCQLGALQAIASMVHYDHAVHGHNSLDERCISLRRYAGMALTNLTFGDGNNKALLCTNKEFMKALVAQLTSTADDLLQVTASVLRNLSWRADNTMKQVLNEIGTVTALSHAVMRNKNENTIKSLLSALWNLSAHCSTNKAEFCAVDGALAFLVDMLVYEGPSKTLTIIENAGGILRNVSSHIAVKESYRVILRQRNCLGILLQQLSSESLTIVSNACGTLWNLSARCAEDQKFLLDNKAVPMLSLLIHSKHKMISNGSSAALKNLLNFRPGGMAQSGLDPIAKSMRLKELPSLNVRKQRALQQDLDRNLAETCDNIEITTPPKEHKSIDDFLKMDPGRSYQSGRLPKTGAIPKNDGKDPNGTPIKSDGSKRTGEGSSKSDMPTPAPRRSLKKSDEDVSAGPSSNVEDSGTYQETDLDQITDFSLRYGENQHEESDAEEAKPSTSTDAYGNEILLILEDSVKCYETEGTPYVISNAASVSDLRAAGAAKTVKANDIKNKAIKPGPLTIESSGINTPEKTTNYCEEGTPGYSIYDSYSSLDGDDVGNSATNGRGNNSSEVKFNDTVREMEHAVQDDIQELDIGNGTNPTTPGGSNAKVVTFETPMMFSRHSSLGSLSSVEPALVDDRSSVVSDFSRLASGIMSPSEIPDSPSQMIPHSPRRSTTHPHGGSASFPSTPPAFHSHHSATTRLRSVFEDDVNTFDVENTPAQFSCATSLSNLSLDDEPKIATDSLTKEMRLMNHPSEEQEELAEEALEESMFINSTNGMPTAGTTSDSDETDDDNILLATCINIGMNSRASRGATQKVPSPMNIEQRIVTGIENQAPPAQSGSATVPDDSTSSSDCGADNILEQCIREGIQRSTAAKPKIISSVGNASGIRGIPDSRHSVQGSLSVGTTRVGGGHSQKSLNSSGVQHDDSLSSLSIDSEDDGLILKQAIAAGSQGILKSKTPVTKPTTTIIPQSQQASSSSFTSSSRSVPQYPAPRSFVQQNFIPLTALGADGNDSLSSIDSTDSNDTQNASILQQCIQSGMHKQQSKDKPVTKPRSAVPATSSERPIKLPVTSSPKRSQLPTFKSPSQLERDRQKERERKDEALLMECIQTGMSKGRAAVQNESHIKPPVRHVRQVLAPTDYTQRLANLNINESMNMSKNGETTSVAVSELTVASASYTAPGVVETQQPRTTTITSVEGTSESRNELTPVTNQTIKTGYSPVGREALYLSIGSLNLSNEGHAGLECSNEYPAMKLSNIEYNIDDSPQHESSMEMEVSNEFLMEDMDEQFSSCAKVAKHKDPDLMLKSVDRLTQQLLSTAEYLRTTASNSEADTVYERKSSSNSNNTWNEDTCPNDASFPSISMSAPMIASMNDDDATLSDVYLTKSEIVEEPTPTNEARSFIINGGFDSQPDSLDTETRTIVNDECLSGAGSQINFHVGGEVQRSFRDNITNNYLSSGPFSFDNSSTMTNSTIIAMEANKLVTELLNMRTMADSSTSLDLDHIRPPSGMDTVSGYFEPPSITAPYSPQLPRSRKKSLPLGLMAKRALSHAAPSGSLESVNSSCNLENIKPPSIMDELLDSMISVASITSEIVDNQHNSHMDHSTYDTALSELDDTTTLRSCYDLPQDSTPIPSDFSSAESTPKKVRSIKRALTPKQKRQIAKDRYRTYTVAADMMINDTIDQFRNGGDGLCGGRSDGDGADAEEIAVSEDMIQIEIVEESKRLTPRQRRNEDRSRFQTQVLDPSNLSIPIIGNHQPDCIQNNEPFRSLSSQEEELDFDPNTHTVHAARPFKFTDTTSSDSNSLDDDADMSSIRALTDRFKYIRDATIGIVPIQPKIQTITRSALAAYISSPCTTDMSSLDFEQNSETESCYQNHCIDDETYTVLPKLKLKPKIIKPINVNNGNESSSDGTIESNANASPAEVKVVRGKKKSTYVSPYRKSNTVTSKLSTPKAALPLKGTDVKKTTTIAKLLPRNQTIITKTHVLMNKANLTSKVNNVKSGITKPGFSTSPAKTVADKNLLNKSNRPKSDGKPPIKGKVTTTTTLAPPALPERQGTFVKDEPTNEDVPIVSSAPASPARSKLPSKLPASTACTPTSPAKNSSFISKLKNPLQRSASIGGAKTAITPTGSRPLIGQTEAQKRRTTGGAFYRSPSTPTVPQRSNSNASIKSTAASKREPYSTQPPSRSNSNLNSNAMPPVKKDITSRIAGLWKKTDGSAKTTSSKAGATNIGKPPPGNRLIRSSTFDNSPKVNESPVKSSGVVAKPIGNGVKDASGVVRRIKNGVKASSPAVTPDGTKRISRLGSFINVDETTVA